jgi:hypothetical protein
MTQTTEQLTRLRDQTEAYGRRLAFMNSGRLGGVHDAVKLSAVADLDNAVANEWPLVKAYRDLTATVAANRVEIARLEALVRTETAQAEADRVAAAADKARRLKNLESKLGVSKGELAELLG